MRPMSTTRLKNDYICRNHKTTGGLLMSTKNEVKEEKKKVESQVLETSSQKPMPSIWYN